MHGIVRTVGAAAAAHKRHVSPQNRQCSLEQFEPGIEGRIIRSDSKRHFEAILRSDASKRRRQRFEVPRNKILRHLEYDSPLDTRLEYRFEPGPCFEHGVSTHSKHQNCLEMAFRPPLRMILAKPSFPNPTGLWNLDTVILCWDSG